MFDLTLQIIGMNIQQNEDNVEIQLFVGLPLPMGGKAAMIPAGVVRCFVDRDGAIKTGQEMVVAGEALPKESDLSIVTDPGTISNISKTK